MSPFECRKRCSFIGMVALLRDRWRRGEFINADAIFCGITLRIKIRFSHFLNRLILSYRANGKNELKITFVIKLKWKKLFRKFKTLGSDVSGKNVEKLITLMIAHFKNEMVQMGRSFIIVFAPPFT